MARCTTRLLYCLSLSYISGNLLYSFWIPLLLLWSRKSGLNECIVCVLLYVCHARLATEHVVRDYNRLHLVSPKTCFSFPRFCAFSVTRLSVHSSLCQSQNSKVWSVMYMAKLPLSLTLDTTLWRWQWPLASFYAPGMELGSILVLSCMSASVCESVCVCVCMWQKLKTLVITFGP